MTRTIKILLLSLLLLIIIQLPILGQINKNSPKKKQQKIENSQITPDTSKVFPEPYDFVLLDNNPEDGFAATHFYKNILSRVKYPDEAINKKLFGIVNLRVLVDGNGNAIRTIILNKIDPILSNAAEQAVQNSIFPIGIYQNKTQAYWLNVRIPFPLAVMLRESKLYDSIGNATNGFIEIWKNNYKGLVDSLGNVVIEALYDKIMVAWSYQFVQKVAFFYVQKNQKWGLLNNHGTMIVNPMYDTITPIKFGYAALAIKKGGPYYWGLVDTAGKEIIPCKYYEIKDNPTYYSGGYQAVVLNIKPLKLTGHQGYLLRRLWGYINKSGQMITKNSYEETTDFWHGLARVCNNIEWIASPNRLIPKGKWGFIDTNGIEVIPLLFDEVSYINEELVQVQKNGKYGLFNFVGKQLTDIQYDTIYNQGLAKGLVWISKNLKFGILDYRTGKEIISPRYSTTEEILKFLQSLLDKSKDPFSKFGAYKILDLIYDSVSAFEGRYTMVSRELSRWYRKWGVIDSSGNEIIPCKFSRIEGKLHFLEHGCLAVNSAYQQWGFMDKNGIEKIPIGTYEYVNWFSEGLAAVTKKIEWTPEGLMTGIWGYADSTGQVIIPIMYEDAQMFYNGLARVKLNGKYGMINRSGIEVIPFRYDHILFEGIPYGFGRVKIENKYGIIDYINKKEVVPVVFNTDDESVEEAMRKGLFK